MGTTEVLSILCFLATFVAGSKIIVLLPVASTSHKNVFIPVVEELAARGHQVTFITPIKPKKAPSPNVKEVTLPQDLTPFNEEMQKTLFSAANESAGIRDIFTQYTMFKSLLTNSCQNLFNDSTTKALLKEGKQFDVALVSEFFNDCALATAYLLAKHVIHFSTGGQVPWVHTRLPQPPSYVPLPVFAFSDRMTFTERLINFLTSVGAPLMYKLLILPISQEMLSKYLPEAPGLEEAYEGISFTILNMDPFYYSPRPSLPNVISVGAAHCRPAEPLPKEFTDVIDSSGEHGFIMFGLGSVAKSKSIPIPVRDAFLSAFKRLKQKVIWKFEADLENLPENVLITKWMPQQDLLGHPKLRLFMTHGGLLSMEEALYHAVPVIGIPLFGDQHFNVARAKEFGIGESLDHMNITEESVYATIIKVLNNPSYKENMKKYSGILRDQPEKPLDRAVFWIEYVIRHNGAPHLRSAGEDLNVFQYFLLDVVAFIVVTTATVLGLFVWLVKTALRKFRKQKLQKKKGD